MNTIQFFERRIMKIVLYVLRAFGGLGIVIGLGFCLGGFCLKHFAERRLP